MHGAVDYARGLGFTPASGFRAASDHLGPWTGPSAIGFGRHGKPYFVQGPHDNPAAAILRTLNRSVGPSNFDYLVMASGAHINNSSRLDDGDPTSAHRSSVKSEGYRRRRPPVGDRPARGGWLIKRS